VQANDVKNRPLVYDASRLFSDSSGSWSDADGALAEQFAAPSPLGSALRAGSRGLIEAPTAGLRARLAAQRSEKGAWGEREAAFAAVRTWILDADSSLSARFRPQARRPDWRGVNLPSWPTGRVPRPPSGAVFLKVGLRGWDNPYLERWLESRRDLLPVAVMAEPWALDFPEYESAAQNAALVRGIEVLGRYAAAILAPDAAAADRFAGAIAAGRRELPIRVERQPSGLAGSTPVEFDPVLAAAPYLVLAGPIEARANTLLMLQAWRDLVGRGCAAPKLVIAGRRGRQIEQIAPMLDWCEAIRPYVCEAPDLGPNGLRRLIVHARALLAPAFTAGEAPLLRDARRLGTPIIAADSAPFREVLGDSSKVLHPLDGLAWREAVLRAGEEEPRQGVDDASLPQWREWREGVLNFLGTL